MYIIIITVPTITACATIRCDRHCHYYIYIYTQNVCQSITHNA